MRKDLIYILERDHDGKKFLVPKWPEVLKVGKARDNDVVTREKVAGDCHFALYVKGKECYLADYGGGTVVDNLLVSGNAAKIWNGAYITFKDGNNVGYYLKIYQPLNYKKSKDK